MGEAPSRAAATIDIRSTDLNQNDTLTSPAQASALGPLDVLEVWVRHRRLLILAPLGAGVIAAGISFLIPPTYTGSTTFMPPQQQQGAAAAALSSLGSLAGIAGVGATVKTPGDLYVTLLQSANIEDRIVEKFKLKEQYEVKLNFLARQRLRQNVRISLGKKDGLITVDADSRSPQQAADMANQYVTELRRLTGELALTEAQQRRTYFEKEAARSRQKLDNALSALQSGGFSAGALKAEPKAAAESYAKLKAEQTANEVRLAGLRQRLSDQTPEVRQLQGAIGALRAQLAQLEAKQPADQDADYLNRYREYKYQETLYELLSRQYETARIDESRDGPSVQVIDVATPPELRSKPRRGTITASATLGVFLLLVLGTAVRGLWRKAAADPRHGGEFTRLKAAWRTK
jgi:uncharacterized protein involved in exopolysaccharide biosynthesis